MWGSALHFIGAQTERQHGRLCFGTASLQACMCVSFC